MTELAPVLIQRFFDSNGVPLAGGKLYSYIAATTTPKPTYTDSTGLAQNPNPVILDANGYAEVWIAEDNVAYKFVLADANNVTIFTVDNVQSIAAQITHQINVAGALAILNNLSDLNSVPAALKNLGVSPYTYPTLFNFTSGQAATNLAGETVDGTVYTSVRYEFEIIQGTTIVTTGVFVTQYVNGTWRLLRVEEVDNGTTTGVTFSITQATTIMQLRAADSGLGNGTIKLKKSYMLATP